MMFFNQRVVFSDNAVLSDKSLELNDFRSGTTTLAVTAAEDYLYIGSLLPWGARYIEIGVANSASSVMTVELYENGSTWNEAVDLIDMSSAAGKSLAQSGYIRFQRNRDKVWNPVIDSNDILSGTKIYDLYWLRLKWSGNFSGTTSVKYIGHKFSSDETLFELYPDLNQTALLTQFETGKTTWNDQHYIASNTIVADLTDRKMIISGDQIIDPWQFEEACVHKCAEIIYQGMGSAYVDNRKEAALRYKAEMDRNYKNLDVSADANLSLGDIRYDQGRFFR